MKRRAAAKNPMKESIADHEKPPDTSANGSWHLIALKAYDLYERRGREDGHDMDDWLRAEAIINGEAE